MLLLLTACSHSSPAPSGPGAAPSPVAYELGDTELSDGDSIEITALTGDRSSIEPGGTYTVQGKYTLASEDSASLSFFYTSKGPSGTSRVDPKQTQSVTRGSGTFSLTARMPYPAYPHVSFYSHHSGHSLGGVYFGHGDTLLQHKPWGHAQPAGSAPPIALDPIPKSPEGYAFGVVYQLGDANLRNGDEIEITDVRGTRSKIEPGGAYRVRGRYTLASRDRARIAFFTTAKSSSAGSSPVLPQQVQEVVRGSGTFELAEQIKLVISKRGSL